MPKQKTLEKSLNNHMRNALVHPLTNPAECPPDVTLWLVDLDADPSDWDAHLLSPEEQVRARRFRLEVHARRYIRSHVALRQILSHHTGQSATALQFTAGVHGKPQLASNSTLHFNMSHSGGWAMVGICGGQAIGVDIELLTRMSDMNLLAQHNFSQEEMADFQKTSLDDQQTAFLRCWTRKEACLKALGSGLYIEPSAFEAGLDQASRTTALPVDGQICTMQVSSVDLPIQGLAAIALLAPESQHLAM